MLRKKAAKILGVNPTEVSDITILKHSIDARKKAQIFQVYTLGVALKNKGLEEKVLMRCSNGNVARYTPIAYQFPAPGKEVLAQRPVIIGMGPAGLFCGYMLARHGYRPILLERGVDVETRTKDVEAYWNGGSLKPESNVQFGEGGAGTFSDGKLTTGIKDLRIRKVLTDFVKAGADPDILYKQRAHIGTDVLRTVVKNIRQEIIRLGGEVRFNTRFVEVKTKNKCVKSIVVVGDGREEEIFTEDVVLAIGHSARDTFRYLAGRGIKMQQKPFSIGVRIEHPQVLIDKAQYGDAEGLPPADYKISYHCANGRGVYTFCMCPGGQVVVASSQEGGVVTNGMSNRARNSGTANSGLLVDVRCEDFGSPSPLAGIEFQEKYEKLAFELGGRNYKAPRTTWGEFRDGGESAAAVAGSLPDFAVESIKEAMPHLGRKLFGFDDDDAVLTAVETRSSSPVRFARNENMEGTFGGFYPAGEGAGYAGGIMSAACDGIKAAEKIIGKYKV